MTTLTVDIVLDAHARLGEGPRWDAERGRLWWVDIDGECVHDTDPASGDDVTHAIGQKVGAVAPRHAGGLVLAVASGFALLDPADGAVTRLRDLDEPADVIMNDGACDAAGRFWAGTAAEDERPGAGTLYRLDPDGSVTEAVTGVTLSNGIGWSPDARLMYYVDTATGGIDVFDFALEDGGLANRRRLVDVPEAEGYPDGLTVDDDGAVWVALWEGGEVRRYTPDGRLDRRVPVPTSHVTSCAFGGGDGSTLYITTAAAYLPEDVAATQPHAGALFAVTIPGVSGPPAHRYAG